MDCIDPAKPMQDQTFKMLSKNVRCLLSDSSFAVQLVAYSDFKNMLTYRLDKEVAVVLVSAVERNDGPGSASLIATVEHMEKVSKDEQKALERSMGLEWESLFAKINEDNASTKRAASRDLEYWTQPASKLGRLMSEPTTPKRHAS
jgi:hypothetical protein